MEHTEKKIYSNLNTLKSLTKKLNLLNHINPLSPNPTNWSNILRQFVGNLSAD